MSRGHPYLGNFNARPLSPIHSISVDKGCRRVESSLSYLPAVVLQRSLRMNCWGIFRCWLSWKLVKPTSNIPQLTLLAPGDNCSPPGRPTFNPITSHPFSQHPVNPHVTRSNSRAQPTFYNPEHQHSIVQPPRRNRRIISRLASARPNLDRSNWRLVRQVIALRNGAANLPHPFELLPSARPRAPWPWQFTRVWSFFDARLTTRWEFGFKLIKFRVNFVPKSFAVVPATIWYPSYGGPLSKIDSGWVRRF